MADNKTKICIPGVSAEKQVDMQALTDKIVQLPPEAISYIAGAVEMASLLSNNKGA